MTTVHAETYELAQQLERYKREKREVMRRLLGDGIPLRCVAGKSLEELREMEEAKDRVQGHNQ